MHTKTHPTIVFADGACSGNPGPGGWGVIIATSDGQVRELGGSERSTTNNRMELTAVINALKKLQHTLGHVEVYTDSVYVIRGITQWSFAWRTRNWQTTEGKDVSNVDLWKELIRQIAKRGKENPVSWKFVRGHSGIPGNERTDAIATSFAKKSYVELYSGPLLKYDVPIYDLPENTKLPEMPVRVQQKKQPYSYLSLINNVPMRHSSWAECEQRVKGRSGAKFKKAMSEAEEKAILKSWGCKLQEK